MKDYVEAPDAELIGERLIPQFHKHLADIPILYFFCYKQKKKGGRAAMATIKKESGLAAQIICADKGWRADEFFAIEIHFETWEQLEEKHRIALIDHELCHATVESTPEGASLKIVTHDLEEFNSVIKRHGLWKNDVREMAETMRCAQIAFTIDIAGDEPALKYAAG